MGGERGRAEQQESISLKLLVIITSALSLSLLYVCVCMYALPFFLTYVPPDLSTFDSAAHVSHA